MLKEFDDFVSSGSAPEGDFGDKLSTRRLTAGGKTFGYVVADVRGEGDPLCLIDDGTFAVNLVPLKCRYVESRPNGATNLAVSQQFLAKYGPEKDTAPAEKAAPATAKDQAKDKPADNK